MKLISGYFVIYFLINFVGDKLKENDAKSISYNMVVAIRTAAMKKNYFQSVKNNDLSCQF